MTMHELTRLTNDKGVDFLKWYKDQTIVAIFKGQDSNWFEVLLNHGVSISLPHKESCAGPAVFGSKDYFIQYVARKSNLQLFNHSTGQYFTPEAHTLKAWAEGNREHLSIYATN